MEDREMLRTRKEWYDHCMKRGTSGDQVFDILSDWKEEELENKSDGNENNTIWVLTIYSKQASFGVSGNQESQTFVSREYQVLKDKLDEHVKRWWDKEMSQGKTMPLEQDERIDAYFYCMGGYEDFDLINAEIST
jgi:hypothetical protein